MPSTFSVLVVHDTEYRLTRAYKAGALAFRNGVPNNCNPHRVFSQAHDEWDYGHVNESAGEHFRFGLDLVTHRASGLRHEVDPNVPRSPEGDPDDEWVRQQRKMRQEEH